MRKGVAYRGFAGVQYNISSLRFLRPRCRLKRLRSTAVKSAPPFKTHRRRNHASYQTPVIIFIKTSKNNKTRDTPMCPSFFISRLSNPNYNHPNRNTPTAYFTLQCNCKISPLAISPAKQISLSANPTTFLRLCLKPAL